METCLHDVSLCVLSMGWVFSGCFIEFKNMKLEVVNVEKSTGFHTTRQSISGNRLETDKHKLHFRVFFLPVHTFNLRPA